MDCRKCQTAAATPAAGGTPVSGGIGTLPMEDTGLAMPSSRLASSVRRDLSNIRHNGDFFWGAPGFSPGRDLIRFLRTPRKATEQGRGHRLRAADGMCHEVWLRYPPQDNRAPSAKAARGQLFYRSKPSSRLNCWIVG
jgi:hypothetical protein